MPKGQKKSKGVPELHNEVKKRVNLSLTPTAIASVVLNAEIKVLSSIKEILCFHLRKNVM